MNIEFMPPSIPSIPAIFETAPSVLAIKLACVVDLDSCANERFDRFSEAIAVMSSLIGLLTNLRVNFIP
jgi:hypothetical protein